MRAQANIDEKRFRKRFFSESRDISPARSDLFEFGGHKMFPKSFPVSLGRALGAHLGNLGGLLGPLGLLGDSRNLILHQFLTIRTSMFAIPYVSQASSIFQQFASRTLSNRHLVVCWSSWKPLGAPWAPLGRFWGLLKPLGDLLAALWGILGVSCVVLGVLWDAGKTQRELLWRSLVALGSSWGALGHSWRARASW